MKKRVLPMLLATTMVAGLAVGCASNGGSNTTTAAPNGGDSTTAAQGQDTTTEAPVAEVTVPEEITIMVDGTLVATVDEGQPAFVEKLQELTGIKKINVVQPDHSGYYGQVSQIMADASTRPDVILLSSSYYTSYASAGILWNMTDAYNASELKERHDAANAGVYVDSVRIDGELYGMPFQRGGGCVTYVRADWLEKVGLKADDITTFDAYIDMLTKFKEAGLNSAGTGYVIGAAGFVGGEAPYINYWPEFYQDAYPTFVQQADGTWIDGFEQDSMKAALQRLKDAVDAGLIDKTSIDQTTKAARTKFMDGEYGAFTYWANHWAATLENGTVKSGGEDAVLVALPPIKEVGQYVNRLSTVWAICDDGDDSNTREASIYKYFIETMQDGGDCQFLWTYGAEGTHYSYAGETIREGQTKVDDAGKVTSLEKTYEEGKFHWLPMLGDESKDYSKMFITAVDALVPLNNATHENPNALAPSAQAASDLFTANCKNEALIPVTDEYSEYNGDLVTLKNTVIAKLMTGDFATVEDAYAYYTKEKGDLMSAEIVASLNALN